MLASTIAAQVFGSYENGVNTLQVLSIACGAYAVLTFQAIVQSDKKESRDIMYERSWNVKKMAEFMKYLTAIQGGAVIYEDVTNGPLFEGVVSIILMYTVFKILQKEHKFWKEYADLHGPN